MRAPEARTTGHACLDTASGRIAGPQFDLSRRAHCVMAPPQTLSSARLSWGVAALCLIRIDIGRWPVR